MSGKSSKTRTPSKLGVGGVSPSHETFGLLARAAAIDCRLSSCCRAARATRTSSYSALVSATNASFEPVAQEASHATPTAREASSTWITGCE